MDSIATYERFQDDDEHGISRDSIRVDVHAATQEDHAELLNDVIVIHGILEKYGLFKKVT